MTIPAASGGCRSRFGRNPSVADQVTAGGAMARPAAPAEDPPLSGSAFGAEVRQAMEARITRSRRRVWPDGRASVRRVAPPLIG
jgi:hypothetical protein